MTARILPNHRLPEVDWRERMARHRERASNHTGPARWRRDRGLPHPVEDFLFSYYPFPLSTLDTWHPGTGLALEWNDSSATHATHLADHPSYRMRRGMLEAAPETLGTKERERLRWIFSILEATADRPPVFACHGLHEWAMVYRGKQVRHEGTLRLRLPQDEIDAVVESRPLLCTHYDAFRFFHKDAQPLNRSQPDLAGRTDNEQPGCVHANMDLYKWAAKSMPWTGSGLLLDCFESALALRRLDMAASPYDLAPWGLTPIPIETTEGRRAYEREQRRLAETAAPLRLRLAEILRATVAEAEPHTPCQPSFCRSAS